MKHLLLTTIAAVVLVGCGELQPPDISIHKSATDGNIEAVKQHLAAGAEVNAKDEDGWTPLHLAAEEGHKETLKLLIDKGADVHAGDKDGDSPLAWAVYSNHMDIVKLLIAAGADVNVKNNKYGWTPLYSAAGGGHKKISELLIDKGADVNAKDDTGMTPFALCGYELGGLSWSQGNRRTADCQRCGCKCEGF